MWDETSSALQDELESGERIVWNGRPKQGIIFRPYDKFVGIFALFGLGGSIAWIYGALSTNAPPFVLIIVALGIAQFLFAGIGAFVKDLQTRKNAFYALTNKRVIVVSASALRQVRSLNLQAVTDISFSRNNDDVGTILFGPAPSNAPWIVHTCLHTFHQNMPLNFDTIENVSTVYELVRKTRRVLLTQ